MRKILALLMCMTLSFVIFTGCSGSDDGSVKDMDSIEIKFAHAIPEGELMNNIIEDWMEIVTERSDGKITFDYHPYGENGTFVELIEQVDLGAVDMSAGEPSLYEPWCPEVSMLYAPMICDDYDHLGRCIYGKPGELISKAMSDNNNIYLLEWVYSGARVIASKEPLHNLDDMKDLKIRSPESQVYIDTFDLFGMSPVVMPMDEMYSAIEQGVVDACECPAQALYEGDYHKITGNICKTRHMYALGTLSANEKFWDSVPEEAQTMMLDSWEELRDDFNQSVVDSENDYYKKLEAEGTAVTEFEDKEAFKKIAEPYWDKKARSIGKTAEEILDAINELR